MGMNTSPKKMVADQFRLDDKKAREFKAREDARKQRIKERSLRLKNKGFPVLCSLKQIACVFLFIHDSVAPQKIPQATKPAPVEPSSPTKRTSSSNVLRQIIRALSGFDP